MPVRKKMVRSLDQRDPIFPNIKVVEALRDAITKNYISEFPRTSGPSPAYMAGYYEGMLEEMIKTVPEARNFIEHRALYLQTRETVNL